MPYKERMECKLKFKDVYQVSLCRNGVLGGLLYVKQGELVYCTNKLTVPAEIRRLHMPYEDIASIEKAAYHTVTITMKNGDSYRFLVFSREKLMKAAAVKL